MRKGINVTSKYRVIDLGSIQKQYYVLHILKYILEIIHGDILSNKSTRKGTAAKCEIDNTEQAPLPN